SSGSSAWSSGSGSAIGSNPRPREKRTGVPGGGGETTIVVSPWSRARGSSSSGRRPPRPPPPGAGRPCRKGTRAAPGRAAGGAGPDVGRDEPDPHEMLAVEGAHSERACREMSLALGPLMGNRVLALPLAAPGERAPVALAFLQAGAALHVHCLDALGAIDLAHAIAIGSIQPPLRDLGPISPPPPLATPPPPPPPPLAFPASPLPRHQAALRQGNGVASACNVVVLVRLFADRVPGRYTVEPLGPLGTLGQQDTQGQQCALE